MNNLRKLPDIAQTEESLIGKLIQAQEEVCKSGQHYYQPLNFSPQAVLTINKNGVIIEVNQAAACLLGGRVEDLAGKPFIEWILQEDQPLFHAILKGMKSKSPPKVSTLRLVTTDGTVINTDIQFAILKEEGRKTIFHLTINDSTRHSNMDNEFYHLAERLQAILSALPDILTEVNNEKVYTWVNPAGMEFFGPDVIGKPASEYFEGEQNTYQSVKPLFNGNKDVIYVESWQRRKDRHKRLLAWHCKVLKDRNGNVTGALSLAHDITDRQLADEKLKESEQRFRSLLQNVRTVAVQGYSPQGETQYWNKASELLYGYSADEAIGRNLLDLIIPPEMRSSVEDAMKMMAKTGQPIPSAELRLMRKDETRVPVYSSHSIVQLPGREQELFCIDIDLTKLKEMEAQKEAALKKLRESETLLNESQRISKTGGWEWDNIDKTMTWTEETYRIHDMDLKGQRVDSREQIAKSIECYDPQYRSLVSDSFNRCVETGEPYDLEVPFISVKGHRLWVRTMAHAIQKHGQVIKVIGNMIDITERKQAEIEKETTLIAFRRSESRYRALFEQAAVGVGLVKTKTGQYIDVNRKFCELIGFSREELLNSNFQSITHPDDIQENVDKNAMLLIGSITEFSIDKRYVRKDGSVVWVNLTASPLWKPGEEVEEYYHIAIVQDITDRKQAELKLQFLSLHDALTGLNNRAFFEESMEHLSHGRLFPISVLMADVDGLKNTNDTFGHDAGDRLLKRAANVLRATFRVEDVIARIGGDEFAVLLPDTSAQEMEAALPRMHAIIEELNACCDGPALQISCGISTAEHGNSLLETLKKADANMYIQKQKRNGDSR